MVEPACEGAEEKFVEAVSVEEGEGECTFETAVEGKRVRVDGEGVGGGVELKDGGRGGEVTVWKRREMGFPVERGGNKI